MPNIMALGIPEELVQELTEALLQLLPHEKPQDVVVTWKPNNKVCHCNAVVRASHECAEQTIRGVIAACREAGLEPFRLTEPYRTGRPMITGFGLPDFIEQAGQLIATVDHGGVTLISQEHYRVTNLLSDDAPYAEIIAPVANWTGNLTPSDVAEQLAKVLNPLCDLELFLPSGMQFLPRIT